MNRSRIACAKYEDTSTCELTVEYEDGTIETVDDFDAIEVILQRLYIQQLLSAVKKVDK